MTAHPGNDIQLPPWLCRILEVPGASLAEQRGAPRREIEGSFRVLSNATGDGRQYMWRALDSSFVGLGFFSRHKIQSRQRLEIRPGFEVGEPVSVRVAHCTETPEGYRVGCVLEPGPAEA